MASSLILTGCGPKSASSTSAYESAGDASSSEQTSDSGSSSDSSTPVVLSLPKGVTDAGLGGSVFSYVKGLTSVSLSDTSLTELPTNLFSRCSNLVSVTLPSTVTKIDEGCFADTGLTWPTSSSVQISLNDNAFAGCGLASVVLPSGVNVNTGEGVFANCVNLVTADLSRAAGNYLGESYFRGCAKLASVAFSSSITTIASSAFEGCVSLADVVIPANVTCIQKDAFYGCSASLRLFLEATSLPGGYEGLFNELDDSNGKAEYLLHSATEPDYASAGTQRYWHRGEGGVPTVWVKA